ncbi:MAG: hypothetical protein IPL10_11355 [Bacteroidetes bacterium]|jgi:hypothetical protein|nr:hypothetical protein [Bacteroidota bacterium]
MLKKSIVLTLAITSFCFVSCKKERSCLCSTSFTATGYSPYTVSTTEKIDSKTTKKTAERICAQTEKQLGKNHTDYISGNEKVSVSCALK